MNVSNKRLVKELQRLYIQQSQKQLLENDYIIYFDESDFSVVHALLKPQHDSVYRHKFVRLDLKIPENYPHSPPEVKFINHDGVRIHPNMYEDGKCCSTILNTWGDDKFEKWTSSMGIETVLLTFHSFLDNNPYTYEPGGGDDPTYTTYVLYQSWYSCLLRYVQYETIPIFVDMITSYIVANMDSIYSYLEELNVKYPYGQYYTRCFEVDYYIIDYPRIMYTLQHYLNYIDFTERNDSNINIDMINDIINTKEYNCSICFDTFKIKNNKHLKLECGHRFHSVCLKSHTENNGDLCPMCRCEINREGNSEKWIISPTSKRRVKVGSKTWHYLRDNGHI
jgi:ubiquitin-protein ligase